jgi:RNA polymerase sigma-70 factor (ECF subfamily)
MPVPRKASIRERFESLYSQYQREVWALAYARWMDADSALDIMQETFLRLWKQLEAGETLDNPRAWLLRVARNLAEDYAKSAFRRNGTQAPELFGTVAANGVPPIDKMERDETFARVRQLLDDLPAADREILTLRYALEYDAPAIADMLGLAVTAVHMRLSRARQRLADKLSAEGVQTSP